MDMLWWSGKGKSLELQVEYAVGYFVKKYQQLPVRVFVNPTELKIRKAIAVRLEDPRQPVQVTLEPRRWILPQHMLISTTASLEAGEK